MGPDLYVWHIGVSRGDGLGRNPYRCLSRPYFGACCFGPAGCGLCFNGAEPVGLGVAVCYISAAVFGARYAVAYQCCFYVAVVCGHPWPCAGGGHAWVFGGGIAVAHGVCGHAWVYILEKRLAFGRSHGVGGHSAVAVVIGPRTHPAKHRQ